MSGNGTDNNYNYNNTSRARDAREAVEIDLSDDPIEIAIRCFSGTPLNRRLWRWYYNMIVYLEHGDSDKAAEIFLNWCYEKKREIAVDEIPDTDHLHARCFHQHLKERFQWKYGAVQCPWKKKGAKK